MTSSNSNVRWKQASATSYLSFSSLSIILLHQYFCWRFVKQSTRLEPLIHLSIISTLFVKYFGTWFLVIYLLLWIVKTKFEPSFKKISSVKRLGNQSNSQKMWSSGIWTLFLWTMALQNPDICEQYQTFNRYPYRSIFILFDLINFTNIHL